MNYQTPNDVTDGKRQSHSDVQENGDDAENTIQQLQRAEEMADKLESKLDSFLGSLERMLSTLESNESQNNNNQGQVPTDSEEKMTTSKDA
jgi:hypothetical protein